MNLAEMKREIIRRIEKTENEALIKKVADLVKNEPQPLSAKEIFDYSVEHYGKTLQRLAE